ncbi:MAG: thioredoxin [Actinomycetaceae bacterium]|nr:thioredoxin [Actinomycetaceae bacterium]
MSEPIAVTDETFEDVVLKADKPVLVDFWATWCPPCRQMTPIVHELASERDDIVVAAVDVDQSPATAAKFGIVSIPSFLTFKDGKLVSSNVGAVPKKALVKQVEDAL